jgi:hypothetical protein
MIDDFARRAQHFYPRLPAVSDILWGEKSGEAFPHLSSSGFRMLSGFSGNEIMVMFVFNLVFLNHVIILLPYLISLDYCTANLGCQGESTLEIIPPEETSLEKA